MKTEILTKGSQNTIDWDKPQWFTYEDMVVFSTGKHSVGDFTGYCLPCDSYPFGQYIQDWDKKLFKPIPEEGLTIRIKND